MTLIHSKSKRGRGSGSKSMTCWFACPLPGKSVLWWWFPCLWQHQHWCWSGCWWEQLAGRSEEWPRWWHFCVSAPRLSNKGSCQTEAMTIKASRTEMMWHSTMAMVVVNWSGDCTTTSSLHPNRIWHCQPTTMAMMTTTNANTKIIKRTMPPNVQHQQADVTARPCPSPAACPHQYRHQHRGQCSSLEALSMETFLHLQRHCIAVVLVCIAQTSPGHAWQSLLTFQKHCVSTSVAPQSDIHEGCRF